MKYILFFLLGYGVHLFGIEAGNMISQLRWEKCIAKMKSGEVPYTLIGGQHYCLGTVFSNENMTLFEKIILYQPNYWNER